LQYRDQFDKFPEYNHNMFEGQLTLWKDEFNNLKKDNFSFVKFEFNKQWTQEEFMKNILNVLNLINEDFNDYLFFRKLEISPNNFNFIQTPHNDDDLKKEVLMCNIRDGVKIFVEKKEYIQENTEVNIKGKTFI
jgi:hypothetical protein